MFRKGKPVLQLAPGWRYQIGDAQSFLWLGSKAFERRPEIGYFRFGGKRGFDGKGAFSFEPTFTVFDYTLGCQSAIVWLDQLERHILFAEELLSPLSCIAKVFSYNIGRVGPDFC